jgi:hypothetical protein
MFTCLALASALILSPVAKPTFHTAAWFDNQINLSNRVLNRTVCADITRLHPDKQRNEFVNEEQWQLYVTGLISWRTAQRDALVKHCQGRLHSEGKDTTQCNLN